MVNAVELDKLINEAKQELAIIPSVPFYVTAKEWLDKNIRHLLVAPHDMICWPKGCLAVGLAACGQAEAVWEHFEKWTKKKTPVYTVDDMLMGQAFLDISEAWKNKEDLKRYIDLYHYEQGLHKMMSFLYAHAKDANGCLPYRPLHRTFHNYADAIGMICPFACGYAVKYQDMEAAKLANKQVRNFFQYGMDEKTGLPYHIYKYLGDGKSEQFGLIGWGRGFGWIAYGLAKSLSYLEKDTIHFGNIYEEMLEELKMIVRLANRYAKEDGLFSASLTDENAPIDTSASAMILHAYQYILSVYAGNDETVEEDSFYRKTMTCYEKGLASLEKYCKDGKVIQAQSECIAVGVYGQKYDSYPWSVGMTLSLLGEESKEVNTVTNCMNRTGENDENSNSNG